MDTIFTLLLRALTPLLNVIQLLAQPLAAFMAGRRAAQLEQRTKNAESTADTAKSETKAAVDAPKTVDELVDRLNDPGREF